MKLKRAAGMNVMAAVNTAPWGPWCPPWNHAWANPGGWVVSGVADVVNMDGGGSTSLVIYDKAAKAPRMLNRQSGGAMRTVALNLGITFKSE